MKNDFVGVTATLPPALNGTHRTAKKKAAAPKRKAESGARNTERSTPQPPVAEFAEIEAKPAAAPLWPLHPVLWFQPERAPIAPGWTGLAIERHHRIPAPGFLHADAAPLDRPGTRPNSFDALAPECGRQLPQSDLEPLGWDPRAICRKDGNQ